MWRAWESTVNPFVVPSVLLAILNGTYDPGLPVFYFDSRMLLGWYVSHWNHWTHLKPENNVSELQVQPHRAS